MIGRLVGKLVSKSPPQLLLDVAGVGYEVEVPMSTLFVLPAVGEVVTLQTHLVVREDAQLLFGFGTQAEKLLFRELIRISGIGPKVANAVLSGLSVDDFWNTVRAGETGRLVKVPGVGKKTAERIVIEMRDKAGAIATGIPGTGPLSVDASPLSEARAALESLGYRPAEALRLTEAIHKDGMGTDQILREALKRAGR